MRDVDDRYKGHISLVRWRMCSMEYGVWRMENGEWSMENGEWRMENGEWRIENGEWIYITLPSYVRGE